MKSEYATDPGPGTDGSAAASSPGAGAHERSRSRSGPCSHCHLIPGCLPAHMSLPDHDELWGVVRPLSPVSPQQSLFDGEAPRELFVVRSGCLQTSVQEASGEEQVLGFHLPGNVAGLGTGIEAFSGGRIVALERSAVCAIHVDQLLEVARRVDGLQRQLYGLIEAATTRAQQHVLMMGRRHAEARVALFLHDWSRRLRAGGLEWTELHLPMRRSDLASFLGLVTETASRAISRLQDQGVVATTDRHHVRILDPERLAALAEIDEPRP